MGGIRGVEKAEMKTMRTEATAREAGWHRRLERLWAQKPASMEGLADGQLHFVDSSVEIEDVEHFQPLDLSPIGTVDGGDPWS